MPSAQANQDSLQPTVRVTERTLSFNGLTNEPLQRTFTLVVMEADRGDDSDAASATANQITGVRFVRGDLRDVGSDRVLLSDKIVVTAVDGDDIVAGEERYTVTISAGAKPGHYSGALQIHYDNQPPTVPLTVGLDVTLRNVPAVDAEVSSKDLTLPVRSPSLSWRGAVPTLDRIFGVPNSDRNAPRLGELTVSLVQNGEGPAELESAEVLTMRGTKGQTLPAAALEVQKPLPSLGDSGAAILRVVAHGQHLLADEYNGTLFVRVRDQPTPIQIPLKVTVKDGVLLPILALAFGPLLGLLITWRNSGGPARNKLYDRIHALEQEIDEGHYLPRAIQRELDQTLNGVKLRAEREALDVLEQAVIEVRDKLAAAQAEGQRFVADECVPLQEQLTAITPGQTLREKLLGQLTKVRISVVEGTVATLADAKSALQQVAQNTAAFQAQIDKFNGLAEDVRKKYQAEVDNAETLARLTQVVTRAASPPVRSGDATPSASPIMGAMGARNMADASVGLTLAERDWMRLQLRTRWLAWSALWLIYLFTIVVGLITFYVADATFGVDMQDYITLVLWGAASGAIGNQAFSLSGLVQGEQGNGQDSGARA